MFMPKVLSLSLCFCQRFTVYLRVFATVFVNSIFSLLSLSFFQRKRLGFTVSIKIFLTFSKIPRVINNIWVAKKRHNYLILCAPLKTFLQKCWVRILMTIKFHTFLGTRGVKLLPGLGWHRINFKMLFIKKRRLQYLCSFTLKYPTASYYLNIFVSQIFANM